jgi:hypothetical protein
MSAGSLVYKVADTPEEFQQIHELNYRTFVEEVGQHTPNLERRRIDRFHDENTYYICVAGARLIGMACTRDQRPFSLDLKIDNLNNLLPPHKHPVEICLLAIDKNARTPQVFLGIMRMMAEACAVADYDLAVVSALKQQSKLYKHLGFEPFGPVVGKPPVLFQPMYMDRGRFTVLADRMKLMSSAGRESRGPLP